MSSQDLPSGAQTPIDGSSILEDKVEQSSSSNSQSDLASIPATGIKAYLLVCFFCMLVAFGGFVFGFDTGTISGFLNMSDFLSRFGQDGSEGKYLSDIRVGLIVSIFNIGCAIGGIFLSKIGDVYGRRIGIISAMVVYVVGIIIQISSQDKWYQLTIGRGVTGLAVGTVSVLSPMFISESAPKHLRGTLVYCYQLCITLGIFIGYCVTYGTKDLNDSRQWRVPLGLCFLWAIFLVVGMLAMPESPRFLIEKKRIEEAKKSLARSNKLSPEDPGVYTEVQLIQAGIDREAAAGSASWMELITGKPAIFRRVIMGIILQSLQQLTGVNYFFYYGTTIFQAVGLQDSFQTSIILGTVNFLSTFVGIWAIERFGRRQCLLVGSAGMFVCFIIYSVIGTTHLFIDGVVDNDNTRQSSGNAMIFITCLFIFFFACTWAGGVFTIISESYPLRIRSKAMSIATAANWMWGFLISFCTPFIVNAINFKFGFVFTGCLLFSFFYVYFFVSETKGLSLEEVDELYAEGIAPWKSGAWVPPSAQQQMQNSTYGAETKEQEQV
ncbi:sugar transporter protein [Scheffersomyces stipitis CBS 6054]|uniref:Sugar transporter protein n=1 Tax=Scheffersomyces stipitis (strain ATCC 58785 / CBS 6054 / NBRC 10063 / NRRL Y-11545) TaxID=322104 RepID=A3GES9_PICST|nr:sugar transporter protein [Scheffersomyces stipitis CBS 6054]EAZ63223.2 sugar transporter protein [Scheffersomyces stipitis CBS 6054]